MSSSAYSAFLTPESRLRKSVLLVSVVLIGAGTLLLATLSAPPLVRGFACVVWCLAGIRNIVRLAQNFARVAAIRLYPDGAAELLDADHEPRPAMLADGSVVLRNWAWLRLRRDDGGSVAELLRGDGRKDHDWRRLQVIWRHVGAG